MPERKRRPAAALSSQRAKPAGSHALFALPFKIGPSVSSHEETIALPVHRVIAEMRAAEKARGN